MAKTKKYPKKPKANASVKVMENYLTKVADIKKHNDKVKKDEVAAKKKKADLKKRIEGLGSLR